MSQGQLRYGAAGLCCPCTVRRIVPAAPPTVWTMHLGCCGIPAPCASVACWRHHRAFLEMSVPAPAHYSDCCNPRLAACAEIHGSCVVLQVSADVVEGWQKTAVPQLASATWRLDIGQVACSSRHAAIITRKGEVYTWGSGDGAYCRTSQDKVVVIGLGG